MKLKYKLQNWVPYPEPQNRFGEIKETNHNWWDFWIGLADNVSPGIEDFMHEEFCDYITCEGSDDWDHWKNFWKGISSNKQLAKYLLDHYHDEYHLAGDPTWLGIHIRWRDMLSRNESPFVVDLCKKYPEKICWESLCKNRFNDSLLYFAGNYPEKINWKSLSANPLPSAVDILNKYPDKVTEEIVYNTNPNVYELLENQKKNINWGHVQASDFNDDYPNENTVKLFEKYFDEMEKFIHWQIWSMCPEAIPILEKNPDKIDWSTLSINNHPRAVKMLKCEKNRDKIDWEAICMNEHPDIVDFICDNVENNLKKLCFDSLVLYGNSNFIKLIEKYWNNEDFKFLFERNSSNIPQEFLRMGPEGEYNPWLPLTEWGDFAKRPESIHLLKDAFENGTHLKEMEKDPYFYRKLYTNPAIFELDHEANKANAKFKKFAEELMAKVFHPKRVERIIKKYNYNILTEESCYPSDSDEE